MNHKGSPAQEGDPEGSFCVCWGVAVGKGTTGATLAALCLHSASFWSRLRGSDRAEISQITAWKTASMEEESLGAEGFNLQKSLLLWQESWPQQWEDLQEATSNLVDLLMWWWYKLRSGLHI